MPAGAPNTENLDGSLMTDFVQNALEVSEARISGHSFALARQIACGGKRTQSIGRKQTSGRGLPKDLYGLTWRLVDK